MDAKNRKVSNTFVHPLKKGIITSSFQQDNLKNKEALKKILDIGVKKLSCPKGEAAIIIPELSQKVFVFTFESLPALKSDVEKLLRFSLKKQLPYLPEDLRMSYYRYNSNGKIKIITAVSRFSIIKEYEDFFNENGFKVGIVEIPTLSLLRLLDSQWSGLLVNIEEDFLNCLACDKGEILVYRQKSLKYSSGSQENGEQRIENIVQEIETTNRALEDREKRLLTNMLVRMGSWNEENQLYERIKQRISLSIQKIESLVDLDLPQREIRLLAPLIGQMV